jgi:response regulator RpfG family c-di-GMP phosphodiesterase
MDKVLLIVDDNPEIIDVVVEILKDQFDRIVSAATVEEAQQKLNEMVFSFLILDIKLEDRNGAEVVKYLMDNPANENNKCPILILSGIVTEEFAEKFGKRFAGVVMKPFNHEKLTTMVKSVFHTGVADPESSEDFPEAPCDLPFSIPELEQRVSKVLASVKKNAKLKLLFAELNIDRSVDNYVMAHIGMIINISTGICMKMEWSTEKTLEKFVYASYLHDMAISHRPDLARVHGSLFEVELLKDKLSANEMRLIMEHPTMAANKVATISEVPVDVEMMIRQHHELPKENGWPSKLSHTKITPLATVFIISHDLADYIMDHPKWELKDFMAKAKAKYKGQHFAKVLSALNDMT